MHSKIIDVTERFKDFEKLLVPYHKFYEGFGDYNFRHYLEELFENILQITVYNDISWFSNPERHEPIEYDDSSKASIKDVIYQIHNVIENKVVFEGTFSWAYFDDKFFGSDFNNSFISLDMRARNHENSGFGLNFQEIGTKYKILAYNSNHPSLFKSS